jgi:hypothetical protein
MSLGTIAVAFVLVTALFNAAGLLTARWVMRGPESGTRAPGPGSVFRAVWPAATAEALVLTLLSALWFGSLGHGGWLLIFLFLGTLVAGGDRWPRHRLLGTPARLELGLFAAGLLKYLLAGLLLSWCLT